MIWGRELAQHALCNQGTKRKIIEPKRVRGWEGLEAEIVLEGKMVVRNGEFEFHKE